MTHKWIKENLNQFHLDSDFRVRDSWIFIQSGELNIHKDWSEHVRGLEHVRSCLDFMIIDYVIHSYFLNPQTIS